MTSSKITAMTNFLGNCLNNKKKTGLLKLPGEIHQKNVSLNISVSHELCKYYWDKTNKKVKTLIPFQHDSFTDE